MATIAVKIQFVRPARLIAKGLGPWRNNSAPTIIGIGPINTKPQKESILNEAYNTEGTNADPHKPKPQRDESKLANAVSYNSCYHTRQ